MPSGESTRSRLRTPLPAADTLLSPDTACTRPTRRAGREQTLTQTEPKKNKDATGFGPGSGCLRAGGGTGGCGCRRLAPRGRGRDFKGPCAGCRL